MTVHRLILILDIYSYYVDAQFLACMRLAMYANYSRCTSSPQSSRKTLPKNMTTREVQYLRLKTEEPSLGQDPLAVCCAQGNCSFKSVKGEGDY